MPVFFVDGLSGDGREVLPSTSINWKAPGGGYVVVALSRSDTKRGLEGEGLVTPTPVGEVAVRQEEDDISDFSMYRMLVGIESVFGTGFDRRPRQEPHGCYNASPKKLTITGRSKRILLLVAVLTLCRPILAEQELSRIPFFEAPPGSPALGGGFRFGSNPYRGGHVIVDLVPLYLYEGKVLYSRGTSFGVHAFRNEYFTFDVFARYRFMRLDPEGEAFDYEFFEGIDERRQTVDAGFAVAFRGRWGNVRADWVGDAQDRHKGREVQLSYRYDFEAGRWSLSPFANISWMDENLVGYYFGVSPTEARPGRRAYDPDGTTNFGVGLNTGYEFSERFQVFANFGLQRLGDEITDSPLIEDDFAAAAFVGGSFTFDNVFRATTPDPARQQEWSWRLNYGYQAEGNIVGEINVGDVRKSTNADTNIAGLILGKLLIDGPRVDFYGRGGAYRHLENDFQDDFFSFVGYIMAMGHGRFPWSERPSFRWGFGFGFSYAQRVPIVEQIKQAQRDGETAQFLNYLEMTLDFPLHKPKKANIMRNCYAGFTVVHRSGIFNTSDILGNVFGGSDWITLHLECLR